MSQPLRPEPQFGFSQILKVTIGSCILAVTAIAFTISFAALIYAGPLSEVLGVAISISFVGAAVMVCVGSLMHKLPGLSQPQEVTALVLAVGAAGIVATTETDFAGPTSIAFVALGTTLTGIAVLLSGVLKLGRIARYMPFSVLAGFLAATGYLLLLGAVSLVLDGHVDIYHADLLISEGAFWKWAPAVAMGLGITLLSRRSTSDLILPGAVFAMLAGFYVWLFLSGSSVAVAEANGLLLGPFPDSSLADLPTYVARIDWVALASQWPLILVLVPLTLIGALLNMSGLEASLKQETDFDQDLRAVGVSNMAGGLTGGSVGYPMIGETLLANRFGLSRRFATGAIALACIGALLLGTDLLTVLPRSVFAGVIAYLGLDLLVQWLITERKMMATRDYTLVLLIVAAAALFGFLAAIALGFIVAALFFVETYARFDPVKTQTTLAARRSVVERSAAETQFLAAEGQSVAIFELTGYLFFGSAYGFSQRVRKEIEAESYTEIIVDLAGLQGLDTSDIKALDTIAETCGNRGIELSLSGLQKEAATLWAAHQPIFPVPLYPNRNAALEAAESRLLAKANTTDAEAQAIAARINEVLADAPEAAFRRLTLSAGETLVHQGEETKAFYLLKSGSLRAEVARPDETAFVVARYQSGAIVGEMAFYGLQTRSASLVAETNVEVLEFDPEWLTKNDPSLATKVHLAVAEKLAQRLVQTTKLLSQIGA
ncbi:MAG: SulP family inorganic anion transporter [Pseudomonadota bacterium]